ncbi:hypothetical protein EDB86DRAFT_2798786 [Lactarius hatsudake]|nr:hypothetical protein EDB86DRAFT_2798786 [Lactarius hatsudake]
MRLAQSAWLEVDTSTIRNCWKKANILPETTHATPLPQPSLPIASLVHLQEDPVTVAEARLAAALDELESTGALQRSNRMSISELVNPPDEAYLVSKTTNEDIFDAVMEARRAREGGQTGQDDIDEDTLVDPIPTRAEALQMALGLSRYTMDKDDDLLRKMDSVLVSFRRQARRLEMSSLKESKITSYFVQ